MSEQTLLPFIEEYGLSKFVLLIDNLKGKMQEDFKTAVFSANGLLWFGLPDSPDFWQPVDAGYLSCLTSLIAIEHRKWIDIENNAGRLFDNEETYTAKERCILITRWISIIIISISIIISIIII